MYHGVEASIEPSVGYPVPSRGMHCHSQGSEQPTNLSDRLQSISSSNGSLLLSNFLSLAIEHHAKSCRTPSLSLPPHILALSTSCERKDNGTTNARTSTSPRWELRTIELGDGGGRDPLQVFEEFTKGSSPLGQVWLDSARVNFSPLPRQRPR